MVRWLVAVSLVAVVAAGCRNKKDAKSEPAKANEAAASAGSDPDVVGCGEQDAEVKGDCPHSASDKPCDCDFKGGFCEGLPPGSPCPCLKKGCEQCDGCGQDCPHANNEQ